MKPGFDSFSVCSISMELSGADQRCLEEAYNQLEYPSFAAHLANVIGAPIKRSLKLIPPRWYRYVSRSLHTTMGKLLDIAVNQLNQRQGRARNERFYRYLGMSTGAFGGLFGAPTLVLELPLITLIMITAIAEIARQEGEDLDQLETRLACLEVFALGGRSKADDATDTGYYGLRLALEATLVQASHRIAEQGLSRSGSPTLSGFMLILSERFGLAVSEKAAAQLLPLAGAIGGASINDLFIRHFQDMARSHFAVRRLERKYGRAFVEAEYKKLKRREGRRC